MNSLTKDSRSNQKNEVHNFLKNQVLTFVLFSLALAAFLVSNSSYGQDNIYFDKITTDDGLSQNDVNSIYQDAQGFMWFGTHDGLNMYDGYDFTVYNPQNDVAGSINSNLIFKILGDEKGNLWVGTTGRGLNFFDRSTSTFTAFMHDEEDASTLDNDHISDLLIDTKNRLWVATSRGINLLDLNKPLDSVNFQKYHLENISFRLGWDGKIIYDIFEDSEKRIFVGGSGGLYQMARDENGHIYFKLMNESFGLEEQTVTCINQDNLGRLIIGTNQGFYIQEKRNGHSKLKKIAKGQFNSILIDKKGHIWAGSNQGLLQFANSPLKDIPTLVNQFVYSPYDESSISKNIIKSLYTDNTGIIWVGTNGGGINKFDPERKKFTTIQKTMHPNSLSYDKIRAMYEDSKGTLWVGTEGGGLNMQVLSKDGISKKKFKNFQRVSKPFALTEIGEPGNKKLLIGVEGSPGLYKVDIEDSENITDNDIVPFHEVNQSVFAILEDKDKTLWIGTYGAGLQRWIKKDDGYKIDIFMSNIGDAKSISSNIIRNIYEDVKGNIWIGTGDGLCRLDLGEKNKNNPNFKVFKNRKDDKNSLSHNYILSMYESEKGDFWVGTFGGGLNKLTIQNKKVTFKSYSESNGLPNNVIKGILEDSEGSLWLSTNQGISKFCPKEETFKNYDVNDGLQSNEFQELACLKRANGQMLFGGVNGFNTFFPEDIEENSFRAETIITNLSIFNKEINVGEKIGGRVLLNEPISNTDQIELKYRENNFSFAFAALHYAAPQKNQFAYMLEGFDEEWITTTSDKRFATYTNLAPGSYTLKVKASNNDGLWDDSPTALKIKVIPPIYRTNVAYAFYGLLILGLLWWFWRYTFIRTTEKHQLQLEHIEKEQSEELQRVKLEFFTNISHEFRTPLTLIKGPLEYLQKNAGSLDQETVDEQHTLMHKNTNYLLRLVNQLLDFRKLNQGKMRLVVRNTDVISFIKEVVEPFQFLAHKKAIHLNINTKHRSLITWFDHEALEKIMNNLLSNAFKFTPENGHIVTSIHKETINEQNHLVLRVKDSGTGIEKDKLNDIFQRFYVEKDENQVNPEGMGIGLSFTKDLIELHQGSIKVISEQGKGTEFIVILPMNKDAYENVKGITCKESTDSDFLVRSSETESFAIGLNDELADENLSKSRSKQPVLLIVDDNADIRSFIKQSLKDSYTIYESENGKQGLETANEILPNIILSDVVMPMMDGIEFCNLIKTKEETSHIPVVMLTAKSSEESKLEGLKSGADDYLTKPFNMEMLKLKLANIVKQRNELRKRFNRNIAIQPSEVTVTSTDEKFLSQAMEIVEKHMMNTDFNVEMMVKEMGLSRSNLYLKFKEITGLSSSEFIRNVRLKRAVQLFESSDLSVKEIMYMTGFNTASYFSKCFKKQFGVIPSEYVSKMKNGKKALGS
ncbi:two-component regulator propeller domain-containing protein [Croceitalea marina]|uniref:histidine kinase n=1 Tax=Croceitalea marina TaxID=1775166 RepID=A0ABW5MVQ3_9FLAO